MEEKPFYYNPHPQTDEKRDLEKEFEESKKQTIRNIILLIYAFVLAGIICVTIHFVQKL